MSEIVIITGDFVTTGGMDRANYAMADYLSRAGRPVTLVAHRVAKELTARPNVRFHRVPKPLGSYLLGSWPLAHTGRRVARRSPGSRVVANGGNCISTDINWVHYVHSAYEPTTAGGSLRKLKSAVERPLLLRSERAALTAARVVVCNSERTRVDVIRIGVPRDRTHVVYYGTDSDQFRPATEAERTDLRRRFGWPSDRPVVMFIGALGDRRKGFDTLFAAWTDLCRSSDWDAILVVVGRGAELPHWEERSRTVGMTDRIQFLGFRSDVPDLLRAADMLVAPTRYEAYGLGVHEALCCGLPAIVSADAGVAERYPAELAELVLPNPEDPVDLATRLYHCRSDRVRLAGQIAALGESLRGRSWDDMTADIYELMLRH